MAATATRRPLPVWPTVVDAFTFVFTHWWPLLRIVWIWLVASCVALAWYLYSMMGMVSAASEPGAVVAPPVSSVAASVLLMLVAGLLGLSSTAVGQHRLLLLGEQPPAIYLRVDGLVWRYLLRIVVIGLIVLPIAMLAIFALVSLVSSIALPSDPYSIQIMALIALLPAALVACRLGIGLPGISVGRSPTLTEALVVSKGNTWQLCAGWLLTLAPFYALSFLEPQTGPPPASPGMLAYTAVNLAVGAICGCATISFFSLSYRFLVGAPQPPQI